jgi:hypothetical protein
MKRTKEIEEVEVNPETASGAIPPLGGRRI